MIREAELYYTILPVVASLSRRRHVGDLAYTCHVSEQSSVCGHLRMEN